MSTQFSYRWDLIPCPKCHGERTMAEIAYAYLPDRYDYYFEFNDYEFEKSPFEALPSRLGGYEPEVACLECNWRGSKDALCDLWLEFRGEDPLREVRGRIEELGHGVRARYQRTLHNSFHHEISGTAGYKYGIDYHTQIHCEPCCCSATEEFGCKSPAAGMFTVSITADRKDWKAWCRASAKFHLRDQRRHNPPEPKCHLRLVTS